MRRLIKKILPKKVKNYYLMNIKKEKTFDEKLIYVYDNAKIIKKRIMIDSYNGREVNGSMLAILDDFKHKDYEIFISTTNVKKTKNIFKDDIEKFNIKIIKIANIEYFRILSTCQYIYNDCTFPRTYIKTKGQIYVNTWHGTPIKNMGYDIKSTSYSLSSNITKNFLMADYVLVGSNYMQEIFTGAYMLEENEMTLLGSARNEVLFKDKIVEKKRKRILFMPTWRNEEEDNRSVVETIKKIVEGIDSTKFECVVKLHPLSFEYFPELRNSEGFIHYDDKDKLYPYLNTVDILITDYSSIMFDFALKNKKIILDLSTLDSYKEERGVYLDFENLPFTKCISVEEIIDSINDQEEVNYDNFNEKYNTYDNSKIISEIENLKEEKYKKRKTLLLVDKINLEELKFFLKKERICFEDVTIAIPFNNYKKEYNKKVDKLLEKKIKVYVMPARMILSRKEKISDLKSKKKEKLENNDKINLRNAYKREYNRLFGNTSFEKIFIWGEDKYLNNLYKENR